MAYEASEITTAIALQYNSAFLRKVKTTKQLESLLKKGVGKDVKFATSSIRTGFLNLVDSKNPKSFFKYKFPLGFIFIKFRSVDDKPPIQSSKTAKDC